MKQLILLFVFLALAFSCGKESDSDGGSSNISNPMTNSYSGIAGQTAKLAGLEPGSSSKGNNFYSSKEIMAASFGADWDTNNVAPDDTTDAADSIPLKEWMGHQISESAVRENDSSISILGRLKGELGVFCAIGVALGNSNDYPADGAQSATITAEAVSKISSQCDFDASSAQGMTMNFTVSTPTNTTHYDKKVVLNPPNGGTQTVWFRSTSTSINVASVEEYTNNSTNYIGRTVVAYDKSNNILRAEYISGVDTTSLSNGDRIEFSRILYDEGNDEGYIMSMMFEDDTTDTTTEYILTGKPQTSGAKFSLSFLSSTFSGLATSSEMQACILKSNGNIDNDGTYCSATSTSLAGISVNGNAVFTGIKTGYNADNYDTVNEATTLSFTSANFATTSFLTE